MTVDWSEQEAVTQSSRRTATGLIEKQRSLHDVFKERKKCLLESAV